MPAVYICIFHVIYLMHRPHISFLRNAVTALWALPHPCSIWLALSVIPTFPFNNEGSLLYIAFIASAGFYCVWAHVLEHFPCFISIPCITLAGLIMPKIALSFGREVLIIHTLWCPFCQILFKYPSEQSNLQAIKRCWGLQCLSHYDSARVNALL